MNTAENKSIIQFNTYQNLLKTPQWKKKRNLILSRDKNQCQNCTNNKNLQVHHRQYHFNQNLKKFINPWEYNNKYLITLCEKCHHNGHTIFKVPVINIKNK